MKYQSEIVKQLAEEKGHYKSLPHYESECIEAWVEANKNAYPKLIDYQAEWLNYANEHPIGMFPYETLTDISKATIENVVPYAYKSAILKGQTLVNLSKLDEIEQPIDREDAKDVPLIYVKENTDYTIIADITSTDETGTGRVGFLNESKNNWCGYADVDFTKQVKIKITTTTGLGNRLRFHNKNYGPNNSLIINSLVVLEGDYTNIDIPYFEGMQSVKMPVLNTVGKNLFDKEKFIDKNQWSADSNGTYRSISLQLEPNTVYTMTRGSISCTGHGLYVNVSNHRNSSSGSHWWLFHHSGNYNNKISFTTNETGIIYFNSNTVDLLKDYKDLLNEVQLEKGDTATSYEPYKSNILTVNEEIELGAVGEVQDTLNLLTGEVIERTDEITLDVTNVQVVTGDVSDIFEITSNIIPKNNQYILSDNSGINNWGLTVLNNYNYAKNNTISYHANVRKFFIRFETGLYTAESLKQKLIDSPLTLRYQLETESIKTVELTVTNQDAQPCLLKPIEGTMHLETLSDTIQPSFSGEIPVEATTQNLASFIEE